MKNLKAEIGEVNDCILNEEGIKVACTYAGTIGKDASEKLAKQFAASGELIEALNEALLIIDRLCEDYSSVINKHANYTMGEDKRLRSAIKKATE